jgi:hypothetical protein
MNSNDTPIKSPRKWLVWLWIVGLSFCFPIVAGLWAGSLAEALLGDMEPMFIILGSLVIATPVALIGGAALMAMSYDIPSRSLRVVLIGVSIFELVSIPICQGIVAWGRHQRAQGFAPILQSTSIRIKPTGMRGAGANCLVFERTLASGASHIVTHNMTDIANADTH